MDAQERILEFNNKQLKVKYLIQWRPGESDCLSETVYLLKSALSASAWSYYSKIVIELLNLKNKMNETFLIPIPSRKNKNRHYHTKYFSFFLAQSLKGSVFACLKSSGALQEQKGLNLDERSGVKFEFCEEFTSRVRGAQSIILVDDIITSGSTLKSCLETLKPHLSRDCKIDIIALFSREKI